MPKFFTQFDRPQSPVVDCGPISLCQQDMLDMCDLNRIVNRFAKLGVTREVLSSMYQMQVQSGEVSFQDCVGVDLSDSMIRIAKAKEGFYGLPHDVRKHFHDNPEEMINFLGDPANAAQAVELGILPPSYAPQGIDTQPPAQPAPPANSPSSSLSSDGDSGT